MRPAAMAVYRVLAERGPMTEPEIRDALGLTRHRHDALALLRRDGLVRAERRYLRRRGPNGGTQLHAVYSVAVREVGDSSTDDVETALRRLGRAPLADIARLAGWSENTVRTALRALGAVKSRRSHTVIWRLP